MQPPAAALRLLSAKPQNRGSTRRQSQRDSESCSAGGFIRVRGVDLVQLRAGEPLRKPCVVGACVALPQDAVAGDMPQPGDQGGRVAHQTFL